MGLSVLGAVLGLPVAAADEPAGEVRIAHLSPDSPAVDVSLARLPAGASGPLTVAGPVVASALRYGTVGDYRELVPGSYALSVRKAGAGTATAPALSARVEVEPGGARTIALTGRFADLTVQVLDDDLSAPPPGSARVRVLAAAAGAATVDVGLSPVGAAAPTALADGLPFGGAGTSTVVPAGSSMLRISDGSGPSTDLPVALSAGSVTSLLVLDRPGGGLAVHVVVDATAPSVTPAGPVEAGGGGTAGPPVAALAGGLLAIAVLAAAAVRTRRRLVLPLAAVLLAMSVPAASAAPLERPAPVPVPAPTVEGAPAPIAVPPVRVVVPSVGVDTALAGIGLDGGVALVPPQDPGIAGWFRGGPAPGSRGPAVLTGHVDSTAGPGAFFRIGRVAVGDPVLVRRADGSTVRFAVTRVARFPKGRFPTATVYGPTAGAELRLITCGGRFDRSARSYVDDVVVFARASDLPR